MSDERVQTVQVLAKALVILDAVKAAEQPVGVNEIAKRTSVKVATAFRLLKTLKTYGWVFQDHNDKYVIGSKISFVTEKNNFNLALKEIAYYVMRNLTAKEGQAMNLVVRDHEKCYILEQTRTDRMVDYVPPVGSQLPIYASASGKVLLAGVSNELLDDILGVIELRPLTKNTMTSHSALRSQLEEIRANGCALEEGESFDNAFCVAVPIVAPDGQTIAGLSFSGFAGGFDKARIPTYIRELEAASRDVTGRLFPAPRLSSTIIAGSK